ncbi:hypothetical protein [Aeromonas piscicola]|uniref:hypothetical protein n=1 Tax=Aeromonas piscicola TaxID=600645 RepID=UPI0028EF4CFF|nr:hypothetical protein [Aeromonas piscicola]
MLPKVIEVKAIEAIQRIERGTFSEDDIELLLIRLREYSGANSIFREISHFIAHHKRDSGTTFQALYRVYCRMRAYSEFQYYKKQLNLSLPIEKWFYDFVISQLSEIESHLLKKKHGMSRKQAKEIFKAFFSQKKNEYHLMKPPTQELINIINTALSFIKIKPLFSSGEIVSNFIETLNSLGLLQDTDKLKAQSDKLILRLLVLMHKREFHIDKYVFGVTALDFPFDDSGKFKKLELRGTIQVPGISDILFTLVETSLDFDMWCAPDLTVQIESNIKGHYWTAFDTSSDFTIAENGKLQRL